MKVRIEGGEEVTECIAFQPVLHIKMLLPTSLQCVFLLVEKRQQRHRRIEDTLVFLRRFPCVLVSMCEYKHEHATMSIFDFI